MERIEQLLEAQNENQEKILQDISRTMKEMSKSQKNRFNLFSK